MSPDKQFNVKKDPTAARLEAKNKRLKQNPDPGRPLGKRVYNGEKG
ncbi:MAG: hypothetical protein WDA53_01815 [Bacillota bacterium]